MKKILATAAIAMFPFTAAVAADLPIKAPRAAAPAYVPAPVISWNGFYVGGHAGYGWSRFRNHDEIDFGDGLIEDDGRMNARGWFAGGGIGFNHQVGGWVFGIETDVSYSDIRGSETETITGVEIVDPVEGVLSGSATGAGRIEWFGTVRGRIGHTFGPHGATLAYLTGGFAYGKVRTSTSSAFTITPDVGDPFTVAVSDSHRAMHYGWTVGAGLEHKFNDAWSLKVEYLYVDLGSETHTHVFAEGVTEQLTTSLTAHTVKAGINFHFNRPPAPVSVRY